MDISDLKLLRLSLNEEIYHNIMNYDVSKLLLYKEFIGGSVFVSSGSFYICVDDPIVINFNRILLPIELSKRIRGFIVYYFEYNGIKFEIDNDDVKISNFSSPIEFKNTIQNIITTVDIWV